MNQEQIGKENTKINTKKDHKKMITIGVTVMLLILAIVVLIIYSKHNTSRYDKYAREAWITARASISEFLHAATAIPRNDYCVDSDTYYELAYRRYCAISLLGEFYTKTTEEERANWLSREALKSINRGVSNLISNADKFYNDRNESNNSNENYYRCTPEEIASLRIMFEVVPDIHDEIEEEMGIYSEGISRRFEYWAAF